MNTVEPLTNSRLFFVQRYKETPIQPSIKFSKTCTICPFVKFSTFVKFKKREKHSWRSDTFRKNSG